MSKMFIRGEAVIPITTWKSNIESMSQQAKIPHITLKRKKKSSTEFLVLILYYQLVARKIIYYWLYYTFHSNSEVFQNKNNKISVELGVDNCWNGKSPLTYHCSKHGLKNQQYSCCIFDRSRFPWNLIEGHICFYHNIFHVSYISLILFDIFNISIISLQSVSLRRNFLLQRVLGKKSWIILNIFLIYLQNLYNTAQKFIISHLAPSL